MSGISALQSAHRNLLDNGQFISNRSGPVTAIRDVHQRLEQLGPEVSTRRSGQLSGETRKVIRFFDPAIRKQLRSMDAFSHEFFILFY